jgi:hypothetical protein
MKRKFTITIDDGVLLPRKGGELSNLAHPLPYLLSQLEVGESFAWPEAASTDWNNLRSIASGFGRRNNKKFATRKIVTKGKKHQLHFWRTL